MQGEFAAEGVDGVDAELGGQIEEIPAAGDGAIERAAGEFAGIFRSQRIENPMAHFGGSGIGKGDGQYLTGLIHLGQQREKTLGQQSRFARTGWSLHQDGARGIDSALTL